MNDFLDEMWPAFEAEVGEQLDALEQLLVRDDNANVDAVFRQFHTIKSSGAMMGFTGMEAVAHAAEDLLALLRRGARDFDTACRDTLLRAVDSLRRQLVQAQATRSAPDADPDTANALRALAIAGGSAPQPAAIVPAPTFVATQTDTAQAASPGRYLDAAASLLPALADACAASDTMPGVTGALADDAEAAGLTVIAALLRRLLAAASNERLPVFAELLARQRHIESLAGRAAGSAETARRLFAALADARATALTAAIEATRAELATASATQWLDALAPLLLQTRLAGLVDSERVLKFARQVLRDIARDARPATPALAESLRIGMALMQDLHPEAGEDTPYSAMAAQWREHMQRALAAVQRADDPVAAPAAVATIDPALLAGMPATAQATLAQAMAQGQTLVDIDADLDALPDNGAAFVEWVTAEGHLLGSHTLFAGSGNGATTRLRFLVTLPMTPADIRQALAAQDPDGTVFRVQFPTGDAAGPGTASATPVAQTAGDNAPAAGAAGQTLRVDSRTLDTFVNRLGELVMLRNTLAHALHDDDTRQGLPRLRELIAQLPGIERREREQLLGLLGTLGQRQQRLVDADSRLQDTLNRLQEDVMSLRVVPVGVVFNRMTRIVRQTADSLGKQVRLEISGDDVRIDKSLVDLLVEPLTHMVRNAVDHGLESPADRLATGKAAAGTLRLQAHQQGNAIVVTVADDGRGLDYPRILARARALGLAGDGELSPRDIAAFIFAPGFSTAREVTAVSGRGVGMDVVRTRLTQIGGQVELDSQPGAGTVFTLRLPLSVAIQSVVMAVAAGRRHALPERHVTELLRVKASDVQVIRRQPACLLRGQTLPLYRLDELLGVARDATTADTEDLQVVVLTDGNHRIGVVVDTITGRQEVFVRDIHPELMRLPAVGGAAILGDGQVVVIADSDKLIALARRHGGALQALARAS